MTTFNDQYFFQTQLVNPDDMNKFYQNVADKLTAYFPVVPCICHGVTYTQTGTSNIFRFAKGMIRFKDQSNPLSAAQSQVQATFANIDVADVTVSCPDASGNYYVVALLTMTQVSPSQVIFSATILPTSMTLAQIAETGKPNLYLPLYRITNTNGIYALSVNSACAVNAYYSLKLEGTPTAPTAPPGTNTDQLATTAFANGVTPVNTKYDFIVTGDNTPTFAAGEEYILYPSNIGGYVEFELTFLGQYKTGSTAAGEVTAKFSIEHNPYARYNNTSIKLLSLATSNIDVYSPDLTNLLTFKAYTTTAPYVINGVTFASGQTIYTIKLNNALGYAGTTNSIFAKVSSNAPDANNVMNGALAPAVLGIVSTPIPALAMTEEGEDEIVGATAVIKADNALFQSSMNSNTLGTNPTTGLTQSLVGGHYPTSVSIDVPAGSYILAVPANHTTSNGGASNYVGFRIADSTGVFSIAVCFCSGSANSANVGGFQGTLAYSSYSSALAAYTFHLDEDGYIYVRSTNPVTGFKFSLSNGILPLIPSLINAIGTIRAPRNPGQFLTKMSSAVGIDNTTINVNAVTGLTQIAPNTTAVNKTLHSTSSSVPAWVQNTVAECSDYVTGTFTPVFGGGTTAGTYTPTGLVATYTKIGNLVTIFCSVGGFTAATGGVGTFKIRSGLPFQPVVATNPSVGSVTYGGITLPTNDILSFVVLNSGSIGFVVNHAGALAGLNPALITTTSTFGFTITYKIA